MSRLIILLSAILIVLATIIQQANAAAVPSESALLLDISLEDTEALDSFKASALPSADIESILKYHNDYRAEHHSPALKWNTTLATYAQNWSDGCRFVHSHGAYGENLGYGYVSWKQVVDAWYDEVKDYRYQKPQFSVTTGHFTQVVWKSTTSIGCGVQTCNNLFRGAKLYTCSYAPHGNIVGIDYRTGKTYFEANVLSP